MSKLNSGVMKKQTATSFDELMKTYYGAASAELSNTAKVEALLTDYYGRPYKRKGRRKATAPAVSLSLSYDSGELLAQPEKEDRFEEYVVQKSASIDAFEEYVVGDGRYMSERAFSASLNIGSVEPVNAAQEYQVDVLEPLRAEGTASPRSLNAAPDNATYPQAGYAR